MAFVFIGCATAATSLAKLIQSASPVVRNATIIEVARLGPATTEQVRASALRDANTIAGFPIQGAVKNVSPDQVKQIQASILNLENYSDLVRRCKNDSLIGIRFRDGKHVVEFAYSQPCMQVFWVMEIDGQVTLEGGVLGPEYGKAILDL